uniref:Uncharacterized protein n=1 Tax=candidate division CPR3 bacterium TaxID=2268181 RepID=A0A7C4M0M6_UNCC3
MKIDIEKAKYYFLIFVISVVLVVLAVASQIIYYKTNIFFAISFLLATVFVLYIFIKLTEATLLKNK